MATYRMIHDEGPWWTVEKKNLFWWKFEAILTVTSGDPQEKLDKYVERKNTVYYANDKKKTNS